MTEIKIEKKQPVWPWILLGIILIALLIYFFGCAHNGTNDVTQQNAAEQNTATANLLSVHENDSTVAAYISFVNNDSNKMSPDHDYSSEALKKLVQATKAMAADIGYTIHDNVDQANEYA